MRAVRTNAEAAAVRARAILLTLLSAPRLSQSQSRAEQSHEEEFQWSSAEAIASRRVASLLLSSHLVSSRLICGTNVPSADRAKRAAQHSIPFQFHTSSPRFLQQTYCMRYRRRQKCTAGAVRVECCYRLSFGAINEDDGDGDGTRDKTTTLHRSSN